MRALIAAAGAATLLGAGTMVIPAVASTTAASHTLRFISVDKAQVSFGATTGGQQDIDVNNAGKTIGFDMLYFAITSRTSGTLNLTVDTAGGFLYGTFTGNISTGKLSNGKVTGGTGKFAKAKGTIKTKNLSATRTAVTISYTT